MHVYRIGSRIAVHTPAKLNLFFEVLSKRTDGFHEIETLMVPISLYDSLTFDPQPSGRVMLDCRWAGQQSGKVDLESPADSSHGDPTSLGVLPPEAENLALRAALLLRERAGVEAAASMSLVKRIPAAAGLGGGSSDAAAALLAANLGWKLNWSRARLMELAAELGSDVPFFLAGGAAICRGRGEKIEPVGQLGALFGVVVRPPAGLSTAQVYAHCRPGRPVRSAAPLVGALRSGDLRRLKPLMHNTLEAAAVELCPWIGRLQHEFSRLNCVAAQMSGSGTSYFAICRHASHARRVAGQLRSRGVGRVYAVRL